MKAEKLSQILDKAYIESIKLIDKNIVGERLINLVLMKIYLEVLKSGILDEPKEEGADDLIDELDSDLFDELDDEDIEIFADWGFTSIPQG